ncbi:polysaccharide deacetylase family protein [Metabacillus malikii]|nr:polysaccharide deacetylase family protein [Metabacillus malikii]
MQRQKAKNKQKRRRRLIGEIGLLCFVILLFVYSYNLSHSKASVEADAATEVKDAVSEKEKDNQVMQVKAKELPNDLTATKEDSRKQEKKESETDVQEIAINAEEKEQPKETANPASNVVYLTFDDGPHEVSDEILTVLDEYNAKATFFMLDGKMKEYPNAVKQMVKNGHSVGLHGVTHDRKKFYQSSKSVLGEMNQARQTVFELTGVKTDLIRTPYGSYPHMTDTYKQAVSNEGYKLWDWNIDSRDWQLRNERFVTSVIEQLGYERHPDEPIVILLHERPETLKHLPKLLEYLKKQKYELKALDSSMTPIQLS